MGIFNKSYKLYFSEESYKEFYAAFLAVIGGDYDEDVSVVNPVDGQKVESSKKAILFEHDLHTKALNATAYTDKVPSMEALANLITLRNYCQMAFSHIENAIKSNAYSYKRIDNDRQLFDFTENDYVKVDVNDVSMMMNDVPNLDDIPCVVVVNKNATYYHSKFIMDVGIGVAFHFFSHFQRTNKGKEFYIKVDNGTLETLQYNYKKFLARIDAVIDACLGRAGTPIAADYANYANVRVVQCHPYEKLTHGEKLSRKDIIASTFTQYTI